MPTIAHVVSNAPPLFGGASRQAMYLAEQLTSAGVDSIFLSQDDHKVDDHSHSFRRINGSTFKQLLLLIWYIRQSNPAAIMVHGGIKRLLFITLLLLKRRGVIFKITTEVEIKRINESKVIQILLNYFSVSVANITNIKCAIKNQWFVSNIPKILGISAQTNLRGECDPTIKYSVIGAICERKRSHEIITQFIEAKRLKKIQPTSELHFFGPYNNTFTEFNKEYIASIYYLKGDRADIKLHGNIDLSIAAFKDNSVLIHSAESEGCPNSVLEFLYLENPVVASNNLQQNFPLSLQSFINFTPPGNLFIESITPAHGAKMVLDTLKNYYIDKIKCVVYSQQ
jgi:hypothetical protein